MPEPIRKPYTFDRVVRIIIFIISVLVVFFFLKTLSGVLLPFFIAWLLAYMTHPYVKFLQEKCRVKNRVIAVIVALISIVVVLTSLSAIMLPAIVDEVDKVRVMTLGYLTSHPDSTLIPEKLHYFMREYLNYETVSKYLNTDNIKSIASSIFSGGVSILSGTVTFILAIMSFFMILLYLVFLLIDYDKIVKGFVNLIPKKNKELVLGIFDDVEKSMNTYFRGQSMVALCVGVLFAIGFSIVGLPMAIALGLFIGVLNLVPYLQLIGFIPAIILSIIQSAESGVGFWWIFMWVLIVFCVVQLIQDLILVPKIMGKAVGLKPAVILLSLSVWGALLGFIGLIIALPLTSLGISYYHKFVLKTPQEDSEK